MIKFINKSLIALTKKAFSSSIFMWFFYRIIASSIVSTGLDYYLLMFNQKETYFVYNVLIVKIYLLVATIGIWSFSHQWAKNILKWETVHFLVNTMFLALAHKSKLGEVSYVFSTVLTTTLMAIFYYRAKLIIKFKFATKMSMEDIDRLGNGDAYLKGHLFEDYVASLYTKLGYKAKTTTELRKEGKLPAPIQKRGGSGEQGVDVIAFDKNGKKIIIQCKHYSKKVENSAIQEIFGAKNLYQADHCVVVTNQFFTKPARELAKSNNVELIDRDKLFSLIQKAS